MLNKPWDARMARRLVQPFAGTALTPNTFTSLRLLTGISGIVLIASGDALNAGAWLIVVSNFLDHTDGEFARLTGKTTRFGHIYDLASDALITIGLFVGFGIGIRAGPSDYLPLVLGIVAGLAVTTIFYLRNDMEQAGGKRAIRQPRCAGFESEDILYLLPLVTHGGIVREFLIAAALGAPAAAAIVLWQFCRFRKTRSQSVEA